MIVRTAEALAKEPIAWTTIIFDECLCCQGPASNHFGTFHSICNWHYNCPVNDERTEPGIFSNCEFLKLYGHNSIFRKD
jgi:hypothetical protein